MGPFRTLADLDGVALNPGDMIAHARFSNPGEYKHIVVISDTPTRETKSGRYTSIPIIEAQGYDDQAVPNRIQYRKWDNSACQTVSHDYVTQYLVDERGIPRWAWAPVRVNQKSTIAASANSLIDSANSLPVFHQGDWVQITGLKQDPTIWARVEASTSSTLKLSRIKLADQPAGQPVTISLLVPYIKDFVVLHLK